MKTITDFNNTEAILPLIGTPVVMVMKESILAWNKANPNTEVATTTAYGILETVITKGNAVTVILNNYQATTANRPDRTIALMIAD